MAWSVVDRWGNTIVLTNERWAHIAEGHWELRGFRDEVLMTVRLGSRSQDRRDSTKYRYARSFSNLPAGYTHINVIVRLQPAQFIITAYPKRNR
ncbi:MAG: hypothetical protein HZB53_13150 [Chloroflexi bacterium]|nr:hypothetical protein [Chloroflexota bacterium]